MAALILGVCMPLVLSNSIRRLIIFIALGLSYPAMARVEATNVNPGDQKAYKDTALLKTPSLPTDIAQVLNWVPTSCAKNLCGGYYAEPVSVSDNPNPLPIGESRTTIIADQPSLGLQSGTSILIGHVKLSQSGRQINADQAYIYSDKLSGKMSLINMYGHVRYLEAGKLLTGTNAQLDLKNKTAEVENSIYRTDRPASYGMLHAWGKAKRIIREAANILHMRKATYTTCSPLVNSWHVKANKIILNKESGRGTASNATLYVRKMPIFYMPYFNFPIDKRRYSGFLYPTFGISNNNGFDLSIPYYLNLAPNYDATITPRWLSKRGTQLSGLFRFLNDSSSGYMEASYLPNDKVFTAFKQDATQKYGAVPFASSYLNRLKDYSNDRGKFNFNDGTRFNSHWSSSLDLNYVTDPYYFQDLGSNQFSIYNDQLLNQADVNYNSDHWHFLGRLQAFQTLHQINQNIVLDQYQRLPQLDLSADYPQQLYGLDYSLDSEFIYFNHPSDFFTGAPYPVGERLHLAPGLSMPIIKSAGFFTPTLQIDETAYSLSNNSLPGLMANRTGVNVGSSPAFPNHINRALPIFDVDTGLYFDRNINFWNHAYRQTLEPRVFYLYVPPNNQTQIPLFDTTLPTFDYTTLFRTNRFVGIDRIGDANQVAAGITTRFLDNYTGADKLDASVGEIYYFRKHSVCLYPDCGDDPTVSDRISPIVGRLSYNLTQAWSAIANTAWDPNQRQTINNGFHIQYMPIPGQVINVGYDYIRGGDPINFTNIQSGENNYNRIDLNTAWSLNQRWSVVADWNYNISHTHPQTYLYGLQYDTCCWAVRFVASKLLTAEDLMGNTTFQNTYYLQFLLKGLGNFGNNNSSNLLISTIPGYQDNFRG